MTATGFSAFNAPTSILFRGPTLETTPVVFGDGLRCVGTFSLVKMDANIATGGVTTHSFGHGAIAGPGTFYNQVWYRNTPSAFCDPLAGFNLSNGVTMTW